MFDELRKNTKVILWITIGAFVLLMMLVWGADLDSSSNLRNSGNAAGKVNGVEISFPYYQQVYGQQLAAYQGQSGREVDDRTAALLRTQTWNNLVQQALLDEQARARGIKASDAEVLESVMNQPSQDVVTNPTFQTNGQFDLAKYQAALRNPNLDPQLLLQMEDSYRRQIPLQKLQQRIMGSVVLSDDELWDSFRMQNEKVRAGYLVVPGERFPVDEASIPPTELERYYAGHKSAFHAPPQATVQFVTIARRYTADDSLSTLEQARTVIQDVRGGEDFLALVDTYSEAPANQRGGPDAAWVSPDQLNGALRAATQSLAIGQLSDVLIEPTGFHVLRIENRQEQEGVVTVQIADVYLPLRPSPDTIEQLARQAQDFRTEVSRRNFEEVAAEMKLAVKESRPFTDKGAISGMGSFPEVQDFAFRSGVGAISPPLEKPDGWTVARVSRRTEARFPDLSEVMDRVRSSVADSMRAEEAARVAEGLLARVRAGESLEAISKSDPTVQWNHPEPFARLGFAPAIGNDAAVLGPLFAAPVGVVPRVLKGRRSAFVLVVEEKIAADRSAFDSRKQNLRDSQLAQRHNEVVLAWLEDLKKKAKIEDYRSGLFQ